RDPRHDLDFQVHLGAGVVLLLDRAPQRRVPGVHPGDLELVPLGPPVDLDRLLVDQPGGVDQLGVLAGVLLDALGSDQARRPPHDVSFGDPAGAADRDEVGRSGPGTDERDPASHHCSPLPPRGGSTTTVDKYGAAPVSGTSDSGNTLASGVPRCSAYTERSSAPCSAITERSSLSRRPPL